MRKWLITLSTTLIVATLAAPAIAGPKTVHTVEGLLVDTQAGAPSRMWVSNDILHVRRVPVSDILKADGQVIGQLDRSVNFNWDQGSGASTAWCSYTLELTNPDLGTLTGHCRGTLLAGTFVGNGPNGHLQGTYTLEPGGVPSIGPYRLLFEIQER